MSSYLEESLAQLKVFEGVVPWMYLDSAGKVTTGVGIMLPDPSAAILLPFQFDNRPAVAQEIVVDFRRVSSMGKGKAAGFYHSPMSVTLSPADIDSLLRQRLIAFESELRAGIPTYEALPLPAKLALLDMAFNLGAGGVLKAYTKLLKAVVAGDWHTASAECHRNGPTDARNEWTKAQFLACTTVPSISAAVELLIDEEAEVVPIEPVPAKRSAKKAVSRQIVKKQAGKNRSPKRSAGKSAAKSASTKKKSAVKKPAKKAAKKAVKKTTKKQS